MLREVGGSCPAMDAGTQLLLDRAVTTPVPPARTRWALPAAAEGVELDAAYSAFFRSQFSAVVRTVYLITHDAARAEDIAQDAFLQLHRNWETVANYEKPEAWVRRVAIRLAMRSRRRDALWSRVQGLFRPPDVDPPDLDVTDAVQRLPRNQRVAIVLHYYEDRPVAEIARILGCEESTARVHLHKGRRRLAEMLGEERGQ
jgi:RNA polymerase sigma-70 factor (ECF subfamily)